jgi:uncharacterized membrane protein
MRTTRDRIRHAILFELIALIIATPLGGLIFGVEISLFGVITVISATIAMIWNYIFNLGFDHGMLRVFGDLRKTLAVRIVLVSRGDPVAGADDGSRAGGLLRDLCHGLQLGL